MAQAIFGKQLFYNGLTKKTTGNVPMVFVWNSRVSGIYPELVSE